jgi:hypothetical protein
LHKAQIEIPEFKEVTGTDTAELPNWDVDPWLGRRTSTVDRWTCTEETRGVGSGRSVHLKDLTAEICSISCSDVFPVLRKSSAESAGATGFPGGPAEA